MKRVWIDAVLVVVTLGFYMPVWLWLRNRDVRTANPGLPLPENVGWVVAGIVLALGAVVVAWDLAETMRRVLTVAAVLLMSYGVYVLGDNAERAARARAAPWSIAPEALAALFAAAFLGIEAGNVFPSPIIRVPAALLLVALCVVFWRVAEEIEPVAKPTS